jgi:hypothetical protein
MLNGTFANQFGLHTLAVLLGILIAFTVMKSLP